MAIRIQAECNLRIDICVALRSNANMLDLRSETGSKGPLERLKHSYGAHIKYL